MEDLKMKRVLLKLTELQCPYIDSDKKNCLSEILFKPCFERYVLLEWYLGKLGLTVEPKENLSSLDRKVQCFLGLFSSLGFCSKNDTDIIEGTAPLSKQLAFWELLSCVLEGNEVFTITENESSDSNDECFEQNKSDYEQCCDYIHNVCDSVPLNTLFDKKLQLFPKYLQKEIFQAISKENSTLSTDKIKKSFSEKIGDKEKYDTAAYSIGNKTLEVMESKDNVIPNEDNLVEMEDHISKSLNNLRKLTPSFECVYNDLKPYLPDVSSQEFVDIGPAFKTAADKLKSVLQLKHSSTSLKSADSDLQVLSSDISNIKLSSENLPNAKLEDYITILSEMNNLIE